MAEPLEEDASLRLEFEIPTGRISTFAKVVYQHQAKLDATRHETTTETRNNFFIVMTSLL